VSTTAATDDPAAIKAALRKACPDGNSRGVTELEITLDILPYAVNKKYSTNKPS
jgi:hypothetical protein